MASGLSAGSFSVIVSDANSCTATVIATITQPSAALSVTATPTNLQCNGDNSGSVSTSVSGGTGLPTYSWTFNSAPSAVTTSTLASVAAGTYVVTATDANMCTDTDTATVTQPAVLTTAQANKVNVLIAGRSTGSATVSASGGTTPYSYSWNGTASSTGNSASASNLPAGSYDVTVSDHNGCKADRTFVITQPPALSIDSPSQTNVDCHGSTDGSASISVSGGVPPYTFIWTGSASTTDSASNLAAGTYVVTVNDQNGASASHSFDISEPTAISVFAQVDSEVSCYGSSNGAASVLSSSGGTGTLSFTWSNSASGLSVSGLAAGAYSVTATDTNGCSKTSSSVTVTQPASALSAAASTTTNVKCFSDSTGAVSVSASGGTGPYTYLWNSGSTAQSPSNVPVGTYIVTVTDSKGCSTTTSSTTVTGPASAVSATASQTTSVSCFGYSDATASVSASGGTGTGYTYLWSNADTTMSVSGLSAATYTVTVKDSNSCPATASVTISGPASALSASIASYTNIACKGDSSGSVSASVSGGTAGYTYTWVASGSTVGTSALLSNVPADTYSLTVLDTKGCSATASQVLSQPSASLSATVTTSSQVTCNGGSNGAVSLTSTGGTGTKTYLWSNGATSSSLTNVAIGSYSVTVTDSNGCPATSNTATVTQPTAVEVSAVVTGTSYTGATDGAVSVTASGGSGSYVYSWSPSGGSSATASGLGANTYTVSLHDSNGCAVIGTVAGSQGVVGSVGSGGAYTVTVSDPVCIPSCQHSGLCRAPGTCDCTGTNYFGNACQNPFCGDGSVDNGEQCDGGAGCSSSCTCKSGWAPSGGVACTPICSPSCEHGGTCTAPDTCDCSTASPSGGWTGSICQVPVCSPSCEHGGTCTAPDTCDCSTVSPSGGWDGSICQYPVCDPTCENGGVCTAPDTCDCSQTAFFGSVCQYGIPSVTYVKDLPSTVGANSKRTIPGQHVAIYGSNFGLTSIGVTATVGGFDCNHITVISQQELHCYVTGQGANVMTIVIVQGISSASNPAAGSFAWFRYDFANPLPYTTGLTCVPPFGSQDILNPAMCNCWAGSASADTLLGRDCDVHAVCASNIISVDALSEFPPQKPITVFKDDKLHIKQIQPIVKGRRDTIIQFEVPKMDDRSPETLAAVTGSPTCSYPGTLWTKGINSLDCNDEYYGVLPWSQHDLCGFVEDTSAVIKASKLRVWRSNLVTIATDTYMGKNGILMFRKSANAYLVSVSFIRQTTVLTSTDITAVIADEKAPYNLKVQVEGGALYDVATKTTIIKFATDIVWPYEISESAMMIGSWIKDISNTETNGVTAVVSFNPESLDSDCSTVEDTVCEQMWILTINTNADATTQVCDLHGSFTFNTDNLLCRDYTTLDLCQSNPNTNFTISVGSTDLCDSNRKNVDASAGLTATLIPYYDEALAVPQNIFQTGDMVYFQLVVNDPISSIDQITFNSVAVSTDGSTNSDTLFQVANPGDGILGAVLTKGHSVFFNITQDIRQPTAIVSPNQNANLLFNFRLLRKQLAAISNLASSVDQTDEVVVTVTIDIWYHSNSMKRAVVSGSIPSVAKTTMRLYDTEEETPEELSKTNVDADTDTDEIGMFSAAAPSILSQAVVFIFAFAAFTLIFA